MSDALGGVHIIYLHTRIVRPCKQLTTPLDGVYRSLAAVDDVVLGTEPSFGVDQDNELFLCGFDGKIHKLTL